VEGLLCLCGEVVVKPAGGEVPEEELLGVSGVVVERARDLLEGIGEEFGVPVDGVCLSTDNSAAGDCVTA